MPSGPAPDPDKRRPPQPAPETGRTRLPSKPPMAPEPAPARPPSQPPTAPEPLSTSPPFLPPMVPEPVSTRPLPQPPVAPEPVLIRPPSQPPMAPEPVSSRPIFQPPTAPIPLSTSPPFLPPPMVPEPVSTSPPPPPPMAPEPVSARPAAPPLKTNIFIVGLTQYIERDYNTQPLFNYIRFKQGNRASFIAALKGHAKTEIRALEWGNEWYPLTGPLDKEIIDILPEKIEYICHNGARYEAIDIAACTARGIKVSYTPRISDKAVADTAIFLMLGAMRNFLPSIDAVRREGWQSCSTLGSDCEGKTLGIFGLGGIGVQLARRARAFDMKIIYHHPHPSRHAAALDAEFVKFPDLVKRSDVLSVNTALTARTHHILSHFEFGHMKDGVIIINTARGAIIDEDALVHAIASGKVAAAGLDVFSDEPRIHPGLINNARVFMLPHCGSATLEGRTKREKLVLANILSALRKGVLLTQVPEQNGGVVVPLGWSFEEYEEERLGDLRDPVYS